MMDDFQQKKNSSMVDFAPFSFEMFAVGYNRKTDWLAGSVCANHSASSARKWGARAVFDD